MWLTTRDVSTDMHINPLDMAEHLWMNTQTGTSGLPWGGKLVAWI